MMTINQQRGRGGEEPDDEVRRCKRLSPDFDLFRERLDMAELIRRIRNSFGLVDTGEGSGGSSRSLLWLGAREGSVIRLL